MPGPLQGHRKAALVLRAGSRLPPGLDLAPVRQVPAEAPDLLVINMIDLVYAEGADLATWRVSGSAALAPWPWPLWSV